MKDGARRNADLDPFDGKHRAALTAAITRHRRQLHITQTQAAAIIGCSQNAVAIWDSRRLGNPPFELVQRHCWTIGHTAGIRLRDLPDVTGDPAVAMWRGLAANAEDAATGDRYDRSAIVALLVAAREALGVTQYELSRRLGVHQSATCQFERQIRRALTGSYQRYARALGGSLRFTLTPVQAADDIAA